ncbi:hypothetical protein MKW98_012778 [Papaver atlanticum]|uniref:ATP synthase subunit alpha, mitochondrial n=1 Tax=Papaver atlanticum TaxID=357466 RepID=A0AAD4XFP0_9MAGN|nr:hypothetical protein MKW98_012778 [Papaver atlanticum]
MSSSMAAAVLRRGGKRLLAAPLISASRSVDAVSGSSSSQSNKIRSPSRSFSTAEFSPRAGELTNLLESRISSFYTNFQVDEVGRVISVGDGIARVYGLDQIQAAVKGFCDKMPLDKISEYEKAILASVKPDLLQSLKAVLTNERKEELESFLRETALSYT